MLDRFLVPERSAQYRVANANNTPMENIPNTGYERSESESESLDLFHQGQKAALAQDISLATSLLKRSLELAQAERDYDWIAYIEGTLAYLQEDTTKIRSLIEAAGDNGKILKQLANGLEQRGSVDYSADYQQQ